MQRMSSRPSTNRNDDSSLGGARGVAPKRGMVLPFTPLAMSFDNVNYYVDMPPVRTEHSSHKYSLNNIFLRKKTKIFPNPTGNEGTRSDRG